MFFTVKNPQFTGQKSCAEDSRRYILFLHMIFTADIQKPYNCLTSFLQVRIEFIHTVKTVTLPVCGKIPKQGNFNE